MALHTHYRSSTGQFTYGKFLLTDILPRGSYQPLELKFCERLPE